MSSRWCVGKIAARLLKNTRKGCIIECAAPISRFIYIYDTARRKIFRSHARRDVSVFLSPVRKSRKTRKISETIFPGYVVLAVFFDTRASGYE